MIEVMKAFRTRTAHKLACLDPSHKCMKVHGEYYQFLVYLRKPGNCETLDAHGMLVDFGDIKDIFNEKIFSKFDHGMIIYKEDPHLQQFIDMDQKLLVMDKPPTAEYISEYTYDLLKDSSLGEYIYKVTVVESEDCAASYWEE